jgi:cysteine desulfurase
VTEIASTDGAGDVYLDHAATTPVLPEVFEAMVPFLGPSFANPSAHYRAARAVRRAVDDAREAVAEFAGCAPDEIVFTSGGTEADNLAVRGVGGGPPGHVVVSAVEHDAVARPAAAAGAWTVGVDRDGLIDLDALATLVGTSTALVSCIAVQNETGVCEPLDAVAEVVRAASPGALLHTDAVQAAPFFPLGPLVGEWDLVTLSGHKIGGPKGIGALVVRRRARSRLAPLLRGGGQEADLRAGTENVAGIVGFAAAAGARSVDAATVRAHRDALAAGITAAHGDVEVTGAAHRRSPGILHLRIPGVLAEELLVLLDDAGIAASAGSACASGALEPSRVLEAMGWEAGAARSAMRFSIGGSTTAEEIARATAAVNGAISRLRAAGGK